MRFVVLIVVMNVSFKSKWERGIKMLVNAAPNFKLSHLYPFVIAANKNSLDICYQLLLIHKNIKTLPCEKSTLPTYQNEKIQNRQNISNKFKN